MQCVKKYAQSPAGKQAHRNANSKYYQTHKEERNLYTNNYRQKYPERYQAQCKVNNAIRDNRLIKQFCHFCGTNNAEGHHPDYSRPLKVLWVCRTCHRLLHKIIKLCEV